MAIRSHKGIRARNVSAESRILDHAHFPIHSPPRQSDGALISGNLLSGHRYKCAILEGMTHTRSLMLLRAFLTVAFLYFGLRKLIGYSTDVAIYEAIGFGQFPRYITGSVEVIGAALLWKRGFEGFAGLFLTATMIVGLSALLIWVGPPYWHMLVLMTASASVAFAYRDQLFGMLRQVDSGPTQD